MDVTDTTTATPITPLTTATSTNSADTQDAIVGFGDDFDDFLTLLTTQVQNQDPLSPLDSTQFVEQLATFSSLEQEVRSNDSLDNIATILSDLQTLIASEWIGQTVSIEASFLPFEGDPIAFTVDTPDDAARAELTVRDRTGSVVYSGGLDTSGTEHVWAGETLTGAAIPNDTLLQFSVEFFNEGGEPIGSAPPRVTTTVNNVATENGKVMLGTDLKYSTDVEDVRKVDS